MVLLIARQTFSIRIALMLKRLATLNNTVFFPGISLIVSRSWKLGRLQNNRPRLLSGIIYDSVPRLFREHISDFVPYHLRFCLWGCRIRAAPTDRNRYQQAY